MNNNWYSLRVFGNQEEKIKDRLLKDDRTKHLIDNIYIPKEKVYSIVKGKKKENEKRLLPGYVLIKLSDKADLENIKDIENTNKVISFLRGGGNNNREGEPKPLTQKEINNLMGHIKESKEKENKIIQGERVIITEGPFNEFEGKVSEVKGKKLKVMVRVFGKETPVEVNKHNVDKINK